MPHSPRSHGLPALFDWRFSSNVFARTAFAANSSRLTAKSYVRYLSG